MTPARGSVRRCVAALDGTEIALHLGLASLIGQRHHARDTGAPYEAGVAPTGSARLRFAAPFYLVALFFVIFDLETVFLFAWASAARALGWSGYLGMLVFLGILSVALIYEWRLGVLDAWGRPPRRHASDMDRQQGGGRQDALVVEQANGRAAHPRG